MSFVTLVGPVCGGSWRLVSDGSACMKPTGLDQREMPGQHSLMIADTAAGRSLGGSWPASDSLSRVSHAFTRQDLFQRWSTQHLQGRTSRLLRSLRRPHPADVSAGAVPDDVLGVVAEVHSALRAGSASHEPAA